ncbi:MAG: hypothetical protein ABW019_01400 [Chitinophagaceae bacterium]
MKPIEPIPTPYNTLNDLFGYMSLSSYQRDLWKWLSLTVSGTYHEQSPTERSDILFLYEKMMELVQAAHAIRVEQREKGGE